MPYRQALGDIVSRIELPFGYTLTIWSSGMIASSRFGSPTFVQVLLFVAGAIAAYLVCDWASYRFRRPVTDMRMSLPGTINVVAVIAAVAVAFVSRLMPSPEIGYPVAGFVATLTYILLITALFYVTRPRGEQEARAGS